MKDNNWEQEFFTTFGADKIWVTPSKDNVETILDIHFFISRKLKEQRERIIEEIEKAFRETEKQFLINPSDLGGRTLVLNASEFWNMIINKLKQ